MSIEDLVCREALKFELANNIHIKEISCKLERGKELCASWIWRRRMIILIDGLLIICWGEWVLETSGESGLNLVLVHLLQSR